MQNNNPFYDGSVPFSQESEESVVNATNTTLTDEARKSIGGNPYFQTTEE